MTRGKRRHLLALATKAIWHQQWEALFQHLQHCDKCRTFSEASRHTGLLYADRSAPAR